MPPRSIGDAMSAASPRRASTVTGTYSRTGPDTADGLAVLTRQNGRLRHRIALPFSQKHRERAFVQRKNAFEVRAAGENGFPASVMRTAAVTRVSSGRRSTALPPSGRRAAVFFVERRGERPAAAGDDGHRAVRPVRGEISRARGADERLFRSRRKGALPPPAGERCRPSRHSRANGSSPARLRRARKSPAGRALRKASAEPVRPARAAYRRRAPRARAEGARRGKAPPRSPRERDRRPLPRRALRPERAGTPRPPARETGVSPRETTPLSESVSCQSAAVHTAEGTSSAREVKRAGHMPPPRAAERCRGTAAAAPSASRALMYSCRRSYRPTATGRAWRSRAYK